MLLLKDIRIDVNVAMPSGDSSLHLAIRLNMIEVVSEILQKFYHI